MTTITIDRATVEQALEALEHHGGNLPWNAFVEVRKDLRDALAQQKDPTDPGNDVDVLREHVRHLERRIRELHAQQAEPAQEPAAYTTGHCENHKQKGGCQLHNLQCGWPDCDRKPTTASSQQAEPVEPVAWKQGNLVTFNEDPYPALGGLFVQFWDGEEVAARVYANDLETIRQRCAKVNTAPPQQVAQQAEPLNLRDPAVQKRLATQWGYVPAAQAELAQEPVAWMVYTEGGTSAYVTDNPTDLVGAYRALPLYTAPPKDKPKPMHPELRKMWEDYFDKCFRAMPVPKQAEPVEQLAELQAMLRAEVDRLIAAGIQPQRKLVPLTEEEIMHIGMTHQSLRQVARAIERAHGIT